MWSGEGGVDERGREGRGSPAHPPPDLVSSSTSPSPAVVDLSLKSTTQGCSLSSAEEGGERIAGTSTPPTSSTSIPTGLKELSSIKEVLLEMTNLKNGHANVLQGCSSSEEGGEGSLEVSSSPPSSTSSAAQPGLKEYSSIKEVLLEMTNRKNGHAKLPPARWGIMKKEDQVLLKVPKFVVDDKKGAFPRPTAFVNPFPADGQPPNGSASLQTSIKDWLNGAKTDLPPKLTKQCTIGKPAKASVRQRFPRGSTVGRGGRKRPLTSIVAQLAGNFQNSNSHTLQTNAEPLQQLVKPASTESVSFLSPHRLSGGEVSITEVSPDLNVVDRLKRLGTVIEVEAEKDSLKLLEKMTKSVVKDAEITPVSKTAKQPTKLPNSRQSSKQRSKLQTPQELPKNPPIQLTVPNEMPIITLINVPSEQPLQQSLDLGQPSKCQSFQSIIPKQTTAASSVTQQLAVTGQATLLPAIQTSVSQSSTDPLPKVQAQINQPPCEQPLPAQSSQVKIINQTSNHNSHQSSSQPPLKDLPILISLTPKIQFAQRNKPFAVKMSKPKTPAKSANVSTPKLQQKPITPSQLSFPSTPITSPVYISKDVTLIPKPISETLHDKIEPSLLEPVIDIVEEENLLAQDGTFLFKTDSFHNIDLPNDQKVFSCDICSAVYTHSNMMRKHYLRLHIARKYISEKDMETFNIDPEPSSETAKDNLIFRCHTCRECFASKNELRSHLTDHPPVDELAKQSNKFHPTYKCENCSAVFKWRKQFGKHKKLCKSSPPPSSEKPELYHCLYCNETFLNANAKRNHILSNHPYVRRKHCCVFCKRDGFPTNVSLFTHLLNDHPTVYFACQICKERFTNLEDLKVHTDKRHDQDDKLKASMSERVSTIKQDKIYYSCDTCQRKFLIENSFHEHVCFPEKQEKPKLQKIKKKTSHFERSEQKTVDLETLFFSRVARNVRENLLHHLDGKIYKEDSSDDDGTNDSNSSNNSRTFLNFSDGFPSSSEILMDHNGADTPTRVKALWEKYNFPKNYDGRCGLTSYIKDTAYLDISTQLIMRRNLQRLNMLPMRESPSDDVPSAVALERLGAECAESFGQLKKEEKKTDIFEALELVCPAEGGEEEMVSLSGEWVRERMYVCSACRWETPCLWTMEDHKYLAHPRVHCPQHELIGEQTNLSQTIYKRLIETDEPPPFLGPMPPPPPALDSLSCTKCEKSGFSSQTDLHIHILECAGVVVEAVGPPAKKRRRRSRRRPRRGLKRNIPQTPQKMPPKQRTKPGDTDTIQRMIANLPAKRISRKVLSTFDENKARQTAQKNKDVKGAKNKKTKEVEKRSQSEPPITPIREHEKPIIFQKPTIIRKEQDYIDTSAEGGDVLSSLRMMPVRGARVSAPSFGFIESVPTEVKDEAPSSQSEDKEMPKLEIEKDISPVESSEIPVLSPVDSTGKEVKKEKEDSFSDNGFNDETISLQVVTPVSNDLEGVPSSSRKRKSTSTTTPSASKKKKPSKGKNESPGKKHSKEPKKQENKVIATESEKISPDSEPLSILELAELDKPPVLKRCAPKASRKKNSKSAVVKTSSEVTSSVSNLVVSDSQDNLDPVKMPVLKQSSKQKGKKPPVKPSNHSNEENEISCSLPETLVTEKPTALKPDTSKQKGRKSKKSIESNIDEKTPFVDNNSAFIPEVSESEKTSQLNSTTTKKGRRKSSKVSISTSEEIGSSLDNIISSASETLDSERLPTLKAAPLRQKGKRGGKAIIEAVSNEDVLSADDITSSIPKASEVDKLSSKKSSSSKQKGKKPIKESTASPEETISTNGDDDTPPVTNILNSEKEPILKSNSIKQKGKRTSKSLLDVSENNVTSATDITPLSLDTSESFQPRTTKPKNRKSSVNKSLIDSFSDENVSSASDIISSVQATSEEEKPSTTKPKGKKKNKATDDSSVDVPACNDVTPSNVEPEEVPSNSLMKNKKKVKRSKDNSDENGTSIISSKISVTIEELTPIKLRGKKNIKNMPSAETLPSEFVIADIDKQYSQEEKSNTEIEKPLTKQRGRKSIKQTPPVKKFDNSTVDSKDETHILTNEIDVEKVNNETSTLKEVIIKKEKTETAELVPTKRGPGRPKGTLVRRFLSAENRRSNRRFLNNNLEVKYDEILPCEEDEVQEVKKPEKPARKPRTIKEQPSSDSTTIVVQVEVHPEPVLKRKIADVNFNDDNNADSDPVSKKVKDEDQIVTKEIIEKFADDKKDLDDPSTSKTSRTNELDSSDNLIETSESLLSSNLKEIDNEMTEIPNLTDKKQLKELKFDKKKIEASAQSPSKGVTCYNSPTIEKEVKIDTSPIQSKAIDIYEFVDNDIIEDSSKNISNTSEISTDNKEAVLETNEVPQENVISIKIGDSETNDSISQIYNSINKEDVNSLNIVVNSEIGNNLIQESFVEEYVKEENETATTLKKKKIGKKGMKGKKRETKVLLDVINESSLSQEPSEVGISNLESNEEANNHIEKEKLKKSKKHKKEMIDASEIKKSLSLKKDSSELQESKKLKKLVKKKKIVKKIVKGKKLHKPQKSSELVNIAGFTWEVSVLETPPVEESSSPPQPDSSVEIKEDPDVPTAQLTPSISQPLPPPNPLPPPSSVPNQATPVPPGLSHSPSAPMPVSSSIPLQAPVLPATILQFPVPSAPPATQLPTPPASAQSWEAPWEPTQPDPSIGTILDSVNKVLNYEPENNEAVLSLPSYSLADLQKAMGASDDEMAVLQQLGEASLQISSTDDVPCTSQIMKGCESDDWNGEKCIMDLDSHTPLKNKLETQPAPSTVPENPPEPDAPSESNSIAVKHDEEEWRWREKSPEGGSSSLLEAHQGKEVLCPSCSCHFMGFPALQKHLAKAHPTIDPASKQKRGAGTPFIKTDLNRLMPLDSSKGPRLICFTCQQILPSDRMGLHLDQEHDIAPEEVSKCASLSGETHDGPVIGERLKSKMSLKLGDLLDRAVNNLLQAKHKPNNTLSGGAVELLTKLCAVRKREGSVKHRLHGARELLSKLQRQQEMKSDEVEEVKVVKKLFSCSICGLKFSLPSSRNKHEVLAHRSYRPVERDYDEYENDWREAPSPPEASGENGEMAITPQCSDCGLSFDSIQDMMRHRVEDHSARRPSVDTVNTAGTGCCPSPVPSSAGSRSQPDSEGEVAEGGGEAGAKPRGIKFRKHGLSRNGSKLVKEKAEAALRELNHLRQRPSEGRRWTLKTRANEVYNFTDDSL